MEFAYNVTLMHKTLGTNRLQLCVNLNKGGPHHMWEDVNNYIKFTMRSKDVNDLHPQRRHVWHFMFQAGRKVILTHKLSICTWFS